MTEEELRKTLSLKGLSLSDEALRSYEIYAALLKEWNGKFNLTAIDEKEEVYEKHFLDCLIPLRSRRSREISAMSEAAPGFRGSSGRLRILL